MSYYSDIKDFHEKFGLAYSGPPRDLDVDLQIFRVKFMVEELCEYVGMSADDKKFVEDFFAVKIAHHGAATPAHQLDALVDLGYVALGTAYCHGYDYDEAWRRVHAANMRKVRAQSDSESSRGSGTYDVVKPKGWVPPDLSDLVQS